MEGHAGTVSEYSAIWPNKFVSKLSVSHPKRVDTPFIDDHQMELEKFEVVGEVAPVCPPLARIGGPSVRHNVSKAD